jgi:hypothetical protein
VEVQFQRLPKFYANLIAKVFCYLDENDPTQEWVAVAKANDEMSDSEQQRKVVELVEKIWCCDSLNSTGRQCV